MESGSFFLARVELRGILFMLSEGWASFTQYKYTFSCEHVRVAARQKGQRGLRIAFLFFYCVPMPAVDIG